MKPLVSNRARVDIDIDGARPSASTPQLDRELRAFEGPAANVEAPTQFEPAPTQALQLQRRVVGHDLAPSTNGGRGNVQRSRDVGGALEMRENIRFQHRRATLTRVGNVYQLQLTAREAKTDNGVLTLVNDMSSTIKERLLEAMGDKFTAADLAQACNVSKVAVHKWLTGQTKTLRAQTLAAAAKLLGVRAEWLRTGKGPKSLDEVEAANARVDRLEQAFLRLLEPLSDAVKLLEEIRKEQGNDRGNVKRSKSKRAS